MTLWKPTVCECEILIGNDGTIQGTQKVCKFHAALSSDLPALMEKVRDECVLLTCASELVKEEAAKLAEEDDKEHLKFNQARDQSGELKVAFAASNEKSAFETAAAAKAAAWRAEYEIHKASSVILEGEENQP